MTPRRPHIQQDSRAELLDHLDHSIEARMVEIGGARHGEVLRRTPSVTSWPIWPRRRCAGLVGKLDAQAGVLGLSDPFARSL